MKVQFNPLNDHKIKKILAAGSVLVIENNSKLTLLIQANRIHLGKVRYLTGSIRFINLLIFAIYIL